MAPTFAAMPQAVFRFAPSPNGRLHLGHAYSALLNAELARRAGGRLLLRIEDIDRTRSSAAFERAILDDLAWLGIRHEEPVRRQSEHFADYAAALTRLRDMGLIYPAFLSRGEIGRIVAAAEASGKAWPRDPDGSPLYPGTDRDLPEKAAAARIAAGEPYALRLRMDEAARRAGPLTWREGGAGQPVVGVAADPLTWGDVIIARKEIPTSYHLSVVVDDALQGVTRVVRGEDLRAATAVHRLLQTLLGLPEPVYLHHRLIRDENGRKLSKSERDTGLAALRESGLTPADVRALVGISADPALTPDPLPQAESLG